VVVIFTKLDALDSQAFKALRDKGVSRDEAKERAPGHAITTFKETYLNELCGKRYPPKGYVYLRDLHKADTHCHELMEQTAGALDSATLQMLFVSTQQVNLKLCMTFAVKHVLMDIIIKSESLTAKAGMALGVHSVMTMTKDLYKMFYWFPHVWRAGGILNAWLWADGTDLGARRRRRRDMISLDLNAAEQLQSQLYSLISDGPAVGQVAQFGIALNIIAEHSYLLWDQTQSGDTNPLMTTMGLYKKSIHHQAVVTAVDKAFREGKGCSFKSLKSHKHSDMHNALELKLIQISLDNRLSKNELMQEARLAVLLE